MDPKDIAIVGMNDDRLKDRMAERAILGLDREMIQAPIMDAILNEDFNKKEIRNLLPLSLSDIIGQQMEMTIRLPNEDEYARPDCMAAPDTPRPMSSNKRKAAKERKRIAKLHRKQGRH